MALEELYNLNNKENKKEIGKSKNPCEGYVERDLLPQLAELSAKKLTTYPISIVVHDKKGQERINDLCENFDLNSAMYNLERRLSLYGNGVIVFEKKANDEFDIFVPTTAITKVDPSSGELIYLQIIRYLEGGDLINISTQTYTKKDIKYDFNLYDKKEDAKEDIRKILQGEISKLNGKKIEKEEILKEFPQFEENDLKDTKNDFGFIPAVYFENIPSNDKRGLPDIDRKSSYIPLLNEFHKRMYWELEFNKSKFIEEQEMGINFLSSSLRQNQASQFISNDYVRRTSNFGLQGGTTGSGFQYFETNNQNLINLMTAFNFELKKFWERAGHHQAGSDVGKQLSDLQSEMERGAEFLTFNNKALRRRRNLKELFWKMFLAMNDKDFGKLGEKPKKIKKSDIEVKLQYSKVDIESVIIKNEIMKIQSNLTDRESSISRLQQLTNGEDPIKLAEKFLQNNIKDIKEQQIGEDDIFKHKPIQTQNPDINNPQGSTNNQSDNFHKQKIKNGGNK